MGFNRHASLDAAAVAAEIALELRDAEQRPALLSFERDPAGRTVRVVVARVGELPEVEIVPTYGPEGLIAFATAGRIGNA